MQDWRLAGIIDAKRLNNPMKRILLLSLLLLAPLCARAQMYPYDSMPKNQIDISIGGGTMGAFFYEYYPYEYHWGSDLSALYGSQRSAYEDAVLTMSYHRLVSRRWRAGVEASWSQFTIEETPGRAYYNHDTRTYNQQVISFLPTATWFALANPYIALGMRAGLGVYASVGEYESSEIGLACSFSPVYFQVGRKNFCGFFEYALGNVYYVRLGVGYNF